MISIITAVHNQINMNELFIDSLRKYTHNPYELIIIDNNSTDGSRELFEQNGAIVIRNNDNYSYPYCQNQGIEKASYDVMVFLNNDIIVSPEWDVRLLRVIGKNNYDAVSFASNDRGANVRETRKTDRRWKRIKYALLTLCGRSTFSLKCMFRFMYFRWNKYVKKVFARHGYTMCEGFSGSAIALNRQAIKKIGLWDERLQVADFDLYARSKKRNEETGDIQPLSIIAGVYLHHYGRMTTRSKPVQFADGKNIITMEEKWGKENCDHFIKALTGSHDQ